MKIFKGEIWKTPNEIINGEMLVDENGIIIEIGEKVSSFYENLEIVELKKHEKIIPGFIDPHCHYGLFEEVYGRELLNEESNPITPDLRVIDGLRILDRGIFESASLGGATFLSILPGSTNVIGGLGVNILSNGETISEDGLKIALGDNPLITYKEKGIKTKMKVASIIREAFNNNKSDIIVKALAREIKVRVHCHRGEDILLALSLQKEFNLDMILEHVTEGHFYLKEIKESGVGVILGPFFVGRPKVEMANLRRDIVKVFLDYGIDVGVMTDYPSNPPEMLRNILYEMIRWGIKKEKALEIITLGNSKVIGIDNIAGSLEVGKMGNILVFDGDPYLYESHINKVYLKGRELIWEEKY